MLQFIRDRATGWLAWFIIILICIPFALWGIQEYASPQGSLTVATVNDAEIGYYEFQNTYQRQRRQMEQMLRQRLTGEAIERRLRDQTLEQMVNDELLLQTTLAAGLRVGDGQLAETIRTLPAFAGDRPTPAAMPIRPTPRVPATVQELPMDTATIIDMTQAET